MTDNERKELIQCAAVIFAMLEQDGNDLANDLDQRRSSETGRGTDAVFRLVRAERVRQDEKWGTDRHHTRQEWAAILAEEVGEWADEVAVGAIRAEQPSAQRGKMFKFLASLSDAGNVARAWLEAHEWPERQQEVFNREAKGE